tara:strand:- start:304 stop:621 length:318 start_codon:yes stop_codon:yes gene_type:complete
MHYKDWSTLKAAGKVSFKEIAAVAGVEAVFNSDGSVKTDSVSSQKAYTVLEKKSYNPDTGAESTVEQKLSLVDLEREESQLSSELARVQAELTEVGKMIVEIKKV